MANAVFIQNPDSIYDDRPGLAYHFPRSYLRRVKRTVGDWVIFYEGKRGAKGYVGIQRVASVAPDPAREDHFYAFLDLSTRWDFERIVPRADPTGSAWEASLRGTDGRPITGGANAAAVRLLSFAEFTAIVTAGLEPLQAPEALPRDQAAHQLSGFAEVQAPFGNAALRPLRPEVLVSRAARDASFARMVRMACKGRCAISGLDLRNGGGRAEVQAAHIRPVHADGPDTVQNGLALSGTVHWMFDRGLIAVGARHEILVSDNKVAPDVRQRLICPGGRLHLPENPRHHPHPEFLRWHRENVFGAAA